jgi:putative ABC transport system substrate-binding protein
MKLFKRILALALVAACALSLVACNVAEDDGKYNIGICQLLDHPALNAATEGFQQALKDILGEENITFDYQNAANDANLCLTICNNFASANVDLIMANATPALTAASKATKTIPVLGTSITEYGVALSIENFDGTVGGNVSGTSDLAPLDQQAQMIIDLVPDAKTVGILYCSAEANSLYQVEVVEKYLQDKGLTVKRYAIADVNAAAVVSAQASEECDALYAPTDNTIAGCAQAIYKAMTTKTPLIAGEEGICSGTGIATLSISYYDLGYKTGEMAAQILKGEADIATMPVAYVDEAKLTKKYNKAICEDLGIDIAALENAGFVAIEVAY